MEYTKHLLLVLFCFFSTQTFSQSISGNVNSSISKNSLGFANVEIYKNGKLVANVLTDHMGNFNVKLDTGTYKCVINYAGFDKVTKEIKVTKDEKSDFTMPIDKGAKYSAKEVEAYSAAKLEDFGALNDRINSTPGVIPTYAWGTKKSKTGEVETASGGKLTAGEINDFSKWKMWTDLSVTELKGNQTFWNFSPSGRYSIQIKDNNNLPLANVKVDLFVGEKIIFSSKTDNTGKAELWHQLDLDSAKRMPVSSLRVEYKGIVNTINNPTTFENGINKMVLNSECDQSEDVDIAIVVDATGSMQDEIEYLKMDLNDVIFKSKTFSSKLNLRFANIFYRDLSDEYTTQDQDFTHTLSESVAFTNRHNADGGGDYEEAVEIALDAAINKLNWNPNARARILFLVLDAPPHLSPETQAKMRELAQKAAEKGIRIVPITGSGTNKNTEYLMRCLALTTNGTYTFLTSHSSIGEAHIEPSTDKYDNEILNDLLVRIIKSYTYMPDCENKIADLEINLPDSIVEVKSNLNLSNTTGNDSTEIDNSNQLEFTWKFYPNPTDGLITIFANKDIKELYITDLTGKALMIVKDLLANDPKTIDLSSFCTGIYLIRYPLDKKWISGKIILVRN